MGQVGDRADSVSGGGRRYHLAADALDQLFRAQLLRPNKEAWLRSGRTASAGSFAHARAGDCTGAVRAIERGRALLLSRHWTATVPGSTRLDALRHGDLAARYSEISQRLKKLLDEGQRWP